MSLLARRDMLLLRPRGGRLGAAGMILPVLIDDVEITYKALPRTS